jgi:hypothetical protein
MIRHVVMFKLKEGATAAQVDDFLADLRTLPGIVPQIRAFTVGRDIGVNTGNFDVSAVVDFENPEGYLAYRDNPEHQRMIREKGSLLIAQRSAVQFEI